MLILPALATLFTYLYWRPHQITDALKALTINSSLALVGFTYLLDLRTGAVRPRWSPLLSLLLGLSGWALLTVALKAPQTFNQMLVKFATSFLVLLFVTQGLQSVRAIRFMGRMLLLFTVALAILGVQQGLAPSVCYVRGDQGELDGPPEGFDGRSCKLPEDCYQGGAPGAEYGCEHPGWLGTHSIEGRVRYRGILEDPNELAWVIAMGLPFGFVFYESKRSFTRLVLLAGIVVACSLCVIMTQSRSGQLSILAVLGVYFIRRFRLRGAVAAAILAIPMLLYGGRSGEDAQSSSIERLGCWSQALTMLRENPFTGVGAGQFTEHHFLTAHNAFLLSLAELGPLGFLLWTSAIYFAFKVTVRVQVEAVGRPEAEAARSWAMGLLASLSGLLVSAVFLSITYHVILWTYLGLSAALYAAVRRHDPEFRVRFGVRDLATVCAIDFAFVSSIAVYLRIKGIS
jgi:hypothetical protein